MTDKESDVRLGRPRRKQHPRTTALERALDEQAIANNMQWRLECGDEVLRDIKSLGFTSWADWQATKASMPQQEFGDLVRALMADRAAQVGDR